MLECQSQRQAVAARVLRALQSAANHAAEQGRLQPAPPLRCRQRQRGVHQHQLRTHTAPVPISSKVPSIESQAADRDRGAHASTHTYAAPRRCNFEQHMAAQGRPQACPLASRPCPALTQPRRQTGRQRDEKELAAHPSRRISKTPTPTTTCDCTPSRGTRLRAP